MEKMNQVSVTEFMSKSKEEMYDMAVEMVEKYNRLVDICNDSAERMADLMAKDDIDKFKKELQSKEVGEFKIQKLADIVVWADNWITELKDGLTEEEFAEDEEVKEFETVKKVALESIDRHTAYTNALKNDIASKDAKIEKLEKELEGRKELYTALKKLVDTKYISIEEHNNIVKKQEDTIEDYEDEIKNLTAEIERRKEGFNKDAEMFVKLKEEVASKGKENERLNRYTANVDKVNHNLVTRVALFEPEIDNLKKELDAREKEIMELNIKIRHQRENLDGVNRTLEIRTKEKESLVKVRNNLNKEIEAHEAENKRLTEKITSLKGTISELSHDIDDYKSWNASLHKDIKELKKNKEDDYGKSGFKRYIEHLIEEEEGKFKGELNKRFSEEVSKISQKRTEEALAKVKLNEKFGVGGIVDEFKEETEAKGVGRTSSGRYPWGAKVNDIPCGEDAIE